MINALPQSIAPSGSGWISGTPMVVNAVSDFIDNVDSYLGEAVTAASAEMTDALRAAALQVPDWAPFADQLGVEWDGSSFVYYFEGTEEQIEMMKTLEYGGFLNKVMRRYSPRSVTRKVAVRMEDRAGKLIQQILERELGLA